MRIAIHVIGSAAVGAAAAAAFAISTGLAFNAHREWEMGAIPLLLAAIVFVGLFAGTIAALACPRHPYVAACLAAFLVVFIADFVNEFKVELTPQMTRDERREFWANMLRDASYGFAAFIVFVALVPLAVHWLPWQAGIPAAAIAGLGFVFSIARRNRRVAGGGLGRRSRPGPRPRTAGPHLPAGARGTAGISPFDSSSRRAR